MDNDLKLLVEKANRHLKYKEGTIGYLALESLALSSKKLGIEEAGKILKKIMSEFN